MSILVNGTSYHKDTPREVIDILEDARMSGARVRIFYGADGNDWLDEHWVIGKIGRSTGIKKIPLMISNSRSMGGPGILTHCIVRIIVNGVEKYRASDYKEPVFELVEEWFEGGYSHAVKVDGTLHARFYSKKSAQRWIDFMQGKRMGR